MDTAEIMSFVDAEEAGTAAPISVQVWLARLCRKNPATVEMVSTTCGFAAAAMISETDRRLTRLLFLGSSGTFGL